MRVSDRPVPGELIGNTNDRLAQRIAMILDLGTYASPVFTGAERSPQGGCVLKVGADRYYFALMRVGGTTWGTDETFRIVQFDYVEDGSSQEPIAWSEEILLGHQTLSGYVDGEDIYLIAGMRPTGDYIDDDAGKGYSVIAWNGALTDQDDVTNVPLFGLVGSGHPFEHLNTATPFVSADGSLIHLLANSMATGDDDSADDTAHVLLTYSRAEIEAASDSLDARPIRPYRAINGPPRANGYFVQAGASNGSAIYAARGYVAPFGFHGLQRFNQHGDLLATIEHDDARGRYTKEEMLDHDTLGNPTKFEVEGLSFLDSFNVALLVVDQWRAGCPIVTFAGKNWASIAASNLNNPPDRSPNWWVETTKTDTEGAWDDGTTYGTGTVSQNDRIVYKIGRATGAAGEQPLTHATNHAEGGASLRFGSNTVDMTFLLGEAWTAAARSEQTGAQFPAFGHYDNGWRIYDLTYGADPTTYVYVRANMSGGRSEMHLRSSPEGLSTGAGANFGALADSDFPGAVRLWGTKTGGSTFQGVYIAPNANGGTGTTTIEGLAAGTVAPLGIPRIVASDVVTLSHTGDTSETTVLTLTNVIPANSVGTKGYIKITTTGFCSANDSSTKYIRTKIAGTTVDRLALASAISNQKETLIRGAGATNSQVGRSTTIGSSYSSSTDATTSVSYTFDTTAALTVTFTIQNAANGDNTTLSGYTIEVCYLP